MSRYACGNRPPPKVQMLGLRRWKLWLACVLYIMLQPSLTQASELAWVLQGGLQMRLDSSPFLPDAPPKPDETLFGAGLQLGFLGGLQISERVGLAWQLDIGDLWVASRSNPQGSQGVLYLNDFDRLGTDNSPGFFLLEEGMFVRELYATFQLSQERSWHMLSVGIRHLRLADAFLFDGFALGAFIRVDLNRHPKRRPYKINFSVFLPDSSWTAQGKLSPVAHLLMVRTIGRQQNIHLNAAYMFDGGNTTSRMLFTGFARRSQVFRDKNLSHGCRLRSLRCPNMPTSTGHHFWLGLKYEGYTPRRYYRPYFVFSASLMAYGGVAYHDLSDLPSTLGTLGFMGDLKVKASYRSWSLQLSFLAMTGADRNAASDAPILFGFRSISPQLRYQHIIYPGGLNQQSSKRTLGVLQLSDDVIGANLKLAFERRYWGAFVLTGLYGSGLNLPSNTAPTDKLYPPDWETNLTAYLNIGRSIKVTAQFDMLFPGASFEDGSRPAQFRFWVGVDFMIRSWRY